MAPSWTYCPCCCAQAGDCKGVASVMQITTFKKEGATGFFSVVSDLDFKGES